MSTPIMQNLAKHIQAGTFIFCLHSSFALAEVTFVDPQTGAEAIYGGIAPKALYHWTTQATLAEIANEKNFSEPWSIYKPKGLSKVYSYWNQVTDKVKTDRGALFAWIHPLLGMRGGLTEIYGDTLVKLDIDVENSRVLRLYSKGLTSERAILQQGVFDGSLDLSKVDLIFHTDGTIKEWIIVNPKIVTNFTADPKVIRKDILKALDELNDPTKKYSAEEIHYLDFKSPENAKFNTKEYAETVALNFLKNSRKFIPSYFLRDENGNYTGTKWRSGLQIQTYLNLRKQRFQNKVYALSEPSDSIYEEFYYIQENAVSRVNFQLNQEMWSLTEILNKYVQYGKSSLRPFVDEIKTARSNPFAVLIKLAFSLGAEDEFLKAVANSLLMAKFENAISDLPIAQAKITIKSLHGSYGQCHRIFLN